MPSDADRDPARVWTTIATGQPPERHGVRALESRQVAGLDGRLQTESPGWSALAAATDVLRLTRPAIASGDERLIPAFWEVAARAGLRTAVVHWWATWPAPENAGIVLSDRAILRLEHGAAGPRDCPARALRGAASNVDRAPSARDRERGRARTGRCRGRRAASRAPPSSTRRSSISPRMPTWARPIFWRSISRASTSRSTRCSDRPARPASRRRWPPSAWRRSSRYYVRLDQAIERLLQTSAASQRIVFLVTQPGRIGTPSLGLFAVSGAGAREARATGEVTSVAPTILAALGIPVAGDLASAPLLDMFAPSLLAAHPVREVTTYRRSATDRTAGRGSAAGQGDDRADEIARVRAIDQASNFELQTSNGWWSPLATSDLLERASSEPSKMAAKPPTAVRSSKFEVRS